MGSFTFLDWAQAEWFDYPPHAAPLLHRVGSPAEAYFIRALFTACEPLCAGQAVAYYRGASIRVQVPCRAYRIDVVAADRTSRLAIEIDGLSFHRQTREQIAADYVRERRLLRMGYIVMRFTASEAMSHGADCWRDVFGVLDARKYFDRRSA